jgi:hypothetical protein
MSEKVHFLLNSGISEVVRDLIKECRGGKDSLNQSSLSMDLSMTCPQGITQISRAHGGEHQINQMAGDITKMQEKIESLEKEKVDSKLDFEAKLEELKSKYKRQKKENERLLKMMSKRTSQQHLMVSQTDLVTQRDAIYTPNRSEMSVAMSGTEQGSPCYGKELLDQIEVWKIKAEMKTNEFIDLQELYSELKETNNKQEEKIQSLEEKCDNYRQIDEALEFLDEA